MNAVSPLGLAGPTGAHPVRPVYALCLCLALAGCRDEVPPPPVDAPVYADADGYPVVADTAGAVADTIHLGPVTREDVAEGVLSALLFLQVVLGDTTGMACWDDPTCRAAVMADTTGAAPVDTTGP